MIGAAVIVVLILIWLASGRVQFTWRISWVIGAFVVICAASLAAGGRLATWIAGGIFEAVSGIVHLISAL